MDIICNANPMLSHLGLELISEHKFKSMVRFKNWVITTLQSGHCLDFTFYHPRVNMHSVLITGYEEKCDSFKVINAQFNTHKDPIEYISWDDLTTQCYDKNPKIFPYFNKKEKLGMVARMVFNGTKIIKWKKDKK